MRELRTFELDEPGRPVSWRARHGQSVTTLEGSLWLTLEGHPADIWRSEEHTSELQSH